MRPSTIIPLLLPLVAAFIACGRGGESRSLEHASSARAEDSTAGNTTAGGGSDASAAPTDSAAGANLLVRVEATVLDVDGAGDVTVTATGEGVFMLHGTVPSAAAHDEVERRVQAVAGVRQVVNELAVRPR